MSEGTVSNLLEQFFVGYVALFAQYIVSLNEAIELVNFSFIHCATRLKTVFQGSLYTLEHLFRCPFFGCTAVQGVVNLNPRNGYETMFAQCSVAKHLL